MIILLEINEEEDQENSKGSQNPPEVKKEAPSNLGAPKLQEGALQEHMKSRGTSAMTISQMQGSNEFITNYFYTKMGRQVKYEPLSEEKLKQIVEKQKKKMMDRKDRKIVEQYDSRPSGEEQQELKDEDEKNNPIIAIEPETLQPKHQSTMNRSRLTALGKTSHYKEQMDKMREIEQKKREEAENYHITKTKDFSVYGGVPRVNKKIVEVIQRPKQTTEINEQYISIDAITDRRIKTMSMANRAYLNAPPVQTIRKQGQHQMIARALDKKQTFEELMAETNSMINYALNDPNKRNFLLKPSTVKFGKLRSGTSYSTEISCKNEDVMPQRFSIRQPKAAYVRIFNQTPGPIAQGMKAILRIEIYTSGQPLGQLQDEFQLLTRTEIYKIPVNAHILSEEEFDSLQAEVFQLHNRNLLLPTVREKKLQDKNMMIMEGSMGRFSHENETSLTGVKLPKITGAYEEKVELDPNKKMKEILNNTKSRKASDDQY